MNTYTSLTVPTQFVEANGVRFAYRRWGKQSGLPLVFNHHFTGNLDNSKHHETQQRFTYWRSLLGRLGYQGGTAVRRLIPIIFALAALLVPLPADAEPQFGPVQNFGPNLKSDCFQPEGIAVDPETGRVFTTSAPFSPGGLGTSMTGYICVLSPEGKLIDKISVKAGPSGAIAMLGALFVPEDGLYVVDIGQGSANPAATGGRLLKIDVNSHAVTTVADGFSFPNDVARDEDGNLYVPDSARGVIYRVNPGGIVSVWSNDPLLAQHALSGSTTWPSTRARTSFTPTTQTTTNSFASRCGKMAAPVRRRSS